MEKTAKMRSMCQFCWSWCQGSPLFSIVLLCFALCWPCILNRSLTATFSGKIEFSVVSTNGEKVFRKKKSIKVGKRCTEAVPLNNIAGVRHPDWETYVWTSSCQIHPTQVPCLSTCIHGTKMQSLFIASNTSNLKYSAFCGWTSRTTRLLLMTR